jgi:hypothetical protein
MISFTYSFVVVDVLLQRIALALFLPLPLVSAAPMITNSQRMQRQV